ncbi:MAG: putative metal-binding motif-containing protein [Sandaracinaceae bacterium]|nr:putative metal-binding motif-containing protein [Sandaracinaceae bacterium]
MVGSIVALLCGLAAGCSEESSAGDGGRDGGTVERDGGAAGRDGGTPFPGFDSGFVAPCGACPAGTVCVDEECVESVCGDGVLDALAAEECDDGNAHELDGCEPDCTFTCADDGECSDGDPCNGDDVCDVELHVCQTGAPLPEGASCATAGVAIGICHGEPALCVAAGCGNSITEPAEECDDGANGDDDDGCRDDCTFSCRGDEDCSDADVCTGVETCDPSSHVCVPGSALACVPSDSCHTVTCDPALGCVESLADDDGDGHAPWAGGTCGDDCDDSDPKVYAGAEELCDGVDNDCDGTTDETAPIWYVDCDGDGYAASLASARAGCSEPGPSATGCGTATAAWTSRRPVGAVSTDCDDALAAVFPGATEVVGNERDDDCDGGELCYLDADGDGYRRLDGAVLASVDTDCADDREARSSAPATDCSDSVAAIHPGATEAPGDGVDQDCDGREICYRDGDDDGYRTWSTFTSTDADCNDPGEAMASEPTGDCCDEDERARPGSVSFRETPTTAGASTTTAAARASSATTRAAARARAPWIRAFSAGSPDAAVTATS